MSDYTIDELMTVQLAREIRDTDWVNHGAVVPLAGAALMLAKKTHAPNVNFFYLGTVFNSVNPSEVNLSEMMVDPHLAYSTSRGLMAHADIVNWTVRGGCDLQFLRPLQMDAYGSVNVSVVGDPAKPRYRFHGIAVADVMVTCKRPILYSPDHDTRTFTETLPFRTGLGHVDGDGWRRNLRAPGGGPYRVHTPLCVMDFESESGQMRVRALHPGVTPDQVQDATGFELIVPNNLPETDPPTDEELRILREVVDPLGVRQTEFRSMRAAANKRIEAARLAREPA